MVLKIVKEANVDCSYKIISNIKKVIFSILRVIINKIPWQEKLIGKGAQYSCASLPSPMAEINAQSILVRRQNERLWRKSEGILKNLKTRDLF